MADLIIENTVRALPFNVTTTYAKLLTTSSAVTYTVNETDAKDGNAVILPVFQNHEITFPNNFIKYDNSPEHAIGKLNVYTIERVSGKYYYRIDQSAVNPGVLFYKKFDDLNGVDVFGNTSIATDGGVTKLHSLNNGAMGENTGIGVNLPGLVSVGDRIKVTITGMRIISGTPWLYLSGAYVELNAGNITNETLTQVLTLTDTTKDQYFEFGSTNDLGTEFYCTSLTLEKLVNTGS